jgi:hypothetical protein
MAAIKPPTPSRNKATREPGSGFSNSHEFFSWMSISAFGGFFWWEQRHFLLHREFLSTLTAPAMAAFQHCVNQAKSKLS